MYYLYNKHDSEELGSAQVVDSIIQDTELKNVDKNVVYGDVYLEESGYVRAISSEIGYSYPRRIIITSHGIDTVDNITYQIIEDITNQQVVENIQYDIKKISDEPNPKSKITKLWKYAKANPSFFSTVIEKVLRIVLGGGGLSGV